jgi:ATP-dependent DNA helicase RecQ
VRYARSPAEQRRLIAQSAGALGRAGRDGERADARLLYRPEDVGAARHLTARGVSEAVVAGVAERLAAARIGELGSRSATLALARLVDAGAAVWAPDGRVRWTGAMDVAVALAASRTEREREVERSPLEMVRRYAEHTGCRRSFLLSYFGQDYPGPCGACDNDQRRPLAKPGAEPFPVGTRVASDPLGRGDRTALRRRPGHRAVRRPRLSRPPGAARG